VKHLPLSARELSQLRTFLGEVPNPSALSLEGMDGLFCALIAGPAWVTPSEYLPLVWGGVLPNEIVSFNVAHVNAMIWLLTRHWNSILTKLDRGAVHPPLIARDASSVIPGRIWAQGFMRGINFVQTGWNELLQHETSSELYRISRLAQETDAPIAPDLHGRANSGQILDWLASAVADAYQYFLDRRLADRLTVELTFDTASRWYK
jgi:yecA family protein